MRASLKTVFYILFNDSYAEYYCGIGIEIFFSGTKCFNEWTYLSYYIDFEKEYLKF